MRVGVFGLGRFGSFWASTLSTLFEVFGFDIDPDRPTPTGVSRIGLAELGSCDTLFICVTIRSLPDVLRNLAPHLNDGQLIADTCSVKTLPAQWMREFLPDRIECLATHPMFGPESAKNGLEGLPIMIDPLRCSDSRTLFWKDSFASLGLSVVHMSCDRHDREAAYSQALTHFVGRSLHRLGLTDTDIATRWYRNLHGVVRQCVRDAPALFEDMQRFNPYAAEMRRRVMTAFQDTLDDLEDRFASNAEPYLDVSATPR